MRHAFAPLIALAFLLPACKPVADLPSDVAPAPRVETKAVDPWLAKFRAAHGGEFNPLSRVDREKMAVLKGVTTTDTLGDRATPPSTGIPADPREAILDVGRKLLGTTEATGNNDGPIIEEIQKSTGIKKGDPYCAAFNFFCYQKAGFAYMVPRSGWSPDWVKAATWKQGRGPPPKPADAFGIWFASKGRVAHTGLIEKWGEASAVTIEANTSPSAEFGAASDRDGDGIWRKRRLVRQIHSVRNWID